MTSQQPKTPQDVLRKRDQAHYGVHFANRRLVERHWADRCYVDNRAALDALMLHLAKAKWSLGRAVGTHSGFLERTGNGADLNEAADLFDHVIRRAGEIEAALIQGISPPISSRADIIPRREGCEVMYADGTPLTPTSSPVVVLQGSNRDMGRQYAAQVLEIYGSFIFSWHAARAFSESEHQEISRWEFELATHTPEILSFAAGIAEGARRAGIPFSDEHAVAMFTGIRPPAEEARPFALAQSSLQEDSLVAAYLGFDEKVATRETPSPCSGAMAWGSASRDGSLVGASSTDHDCTFQATIVAFPERGNAYVFTPYSANGSIPILGHFFLGGHPGVNSQGLAYVHHNGSTMGEPEDQWGYGVRRGPTVMHVLQYCDTAREALDFMLTLPVGDSGISQGTAGGMFADPDYGFSLEARAGAPAATRPILREHTLDRAGGRHSFLYGTNNALAPESGHLNAAPKHGKGYDYSLEGGWFTVDPEVINDGTPGESIKRRITKNSEGRNRFFHKHLTSHSGQLDLATLTALYRTSGTIPEGDFDEVCARYHKGEQWDCAPGHRANAFVVSFRSARGELPLYRACIGPLNRAVNSRDPGHGYYYFDETNAFWELTLTGSPDRLLDPARAVAMERLRRARVATHDLSDDFAGRAQFTRWMEDADGHLRQAELARAAAIQDEGDGRLACLARALRHVHWAQVRAAQVLDALEPPATLATSDSCTSALPGSMRQRI